MGFFDFLRGKKENKRAPAAKKEPSPPSGGGPAPSADEPRKEDLVGEVEGYFRKPCVAVIRVKKGPICADEKIRIKGHTTDLRCAIQSMQIDHKPVERAEKGQCFGLKVKDRVRRGDAVYREA